MTGFLDISPDCFAFTHFTQCGRSRFFKILYVSFVFPLKEFLQGGVGIHVGRRQIHPVWNQWQKANSAPSSSANRTGEGVGAREVRLKYPGGAAHFRSYMEGKSDARMSEYEKPVIA